MRVCLSESVQRACWPTRQRCLERCGDCEHACGGEMPHGYACGCSESVSLGFTTASVRMQYKPSCDVQMQARPGVHARVAPQSTKVATSSPVQYPHATSLCKQKVLGRSERSVGTATARSRLETGGRDGLLACCTAESGCAIALLQKGAEGCAGVIHKPSYRAPTSATLRSRRCACCTSCTT